MYIYVYVDCVYLVYVGVRVKVARSGWDLGAVLVLLRLPTALLLQHVPEKNNNIPINPTDTP